MDRRQLLSSIGVAAATITSPAVAAARRRKGPPEHTGPPEHSNAPKHAGPPAWTKFESGRLELAVSESEWAAAPDASEIDGIPDEARKLPYDATETYVEGMNEGIESGKIVVRGQSGQSHIEFRGRGRRHRGDDR